MRLGVLGPGVVQVVGRDERQLEVAREPDEVLLRAALDLEAVVHELDVDVVAARRCRAARRPPRAPRRTSRSAAWSGSRSRAAGRDDEALAVGRAAARGRCGATSCTPGRGEAIELIRKRLCMPSVVLGEHRHVGVGAAAGDVVAAAVAPADLRAVGAVGARRDVGLDADDRLDARALRLLPELVGAEDVAVVGRRERGHPHPRRLAEEVADAGRPVEHGVLRVHVQVHEVLVWSRGGLGRHRG